MTNVGENCGENPEIRKGGEIVVEWGEFTDFCRLYGGHGPMCVCFTRTQASDTEMDA